jgi:hypothetical protein
LKNQIEIICPAFGRTGSTSLEHALEYLGFNPVYSFYNCIKNGKLFAEWKDIFLLDDPVPSLFEHIRSFKVISDFPICVFSEHIIKNNPDAKVILTLRDEDKWCKSILRLYHLFGKPDVMIAAKISPRIQRVIDVFNKQVWPVIFEGGNLGDPVIAIQNYHKHIEKIKSITNPQNLLEFDVKQGWEPLIHFLELNEVPQIPFPHLNSGMGNIRLTAVQLALRKF